MSDLGTWIWVASNEIKINAFSKYCGRTTGRYFQQSMKTLPWDFRCCLITFDILVLRKDFTVQSVLSQIHLKFMASLSFLLNVKEMIDQTVVSNE